MENFLLLVLSTSPLVLEAELLELLRMLSASFTFLGTEVGGCGGAEFGKDVGPEEKERRNKN